MRTLAIVTVIFFLASCMILRSHRDERAEAMRELAASAVLVDVDDSIGSGAIIAESKGMYLILTCDHVVQGSTYINIKTKHGTVEGFLEKEDPDKDLALVVAYGDLPGATTIPLAEVAPRVYDTLYVMTNPLGVQQAASEGILYTKDAKILGDETRWGFTGFMMPGSSGGIISNVDGELVCVAEAVLMNAGSPIVPEMGFCVGLKEVREFVSEYKL